MDSDKHADIKVTKVKTHVQVLISRKLECHNERQMNWM
jgi:hypothetical protein